MTKQVAEVPKAVDRAAFHAELTFAALSASLFATCAALTIAWCRPMSTMPGMSMVWMRMPGQTWIEAAASFLAMWIAMMAAMMLPWLAPMLWRYRQAVGWPGVLAGSGYFFVWTLFGLAVFPLGALLAALEMKQPALARAAPLATGAVILIAGAVQLTAWKARGLAACRKMPADNATPWRQGVSLGLRCTLSCANWTAILLVTGVMDLRAMAVVTTAITAERLAPAGGRVAQALGSVVIVAGLLLIARAAVQ